MTTLSHHDQSDLEWYFSTGIASFEKSTFGPILERQRALAVEYRVSEEVAQARRDRIREGRWDEPEPGEITARPTAEVRNSGKPSPVDAVLVRYGLVSGILSRMPSDSVAVFQAYYGDDAARWALADGYIGRIGRLGPVMALVPAGRRLLERQREKMRGKGAFVVTPQKVLENEVARQGIHATADESRSLLDTAIDEAFAALERVVDAWNEAKARGR